MGVGEYGQLCLNNATVLTSIGRDEHKIVPAFGWHPWFSYQMFDETEYGGESVLDDELKIRHYQNVLTPKAEDPNSLRFLPEPRPFGQFIEQTKTYLKRFPLALVGEVGLDRGFRIPEDWLPEHAEQRNDALTPGGREGRKLSPYKVSMEHQKKVLTAQLRLAGELQRAVSVHGVQAHGVVYETLSATWEGHERYVPSKKELKRQQVTEDVDSEASDSTQERAGPQPYPPRACMHSYSGSAETVKLYIAPSVPCKIFFSFSTTINEWVSSGDGKVEAAVRAVPNDRILVESDLHTAGERMDNYLEEIVRKICEIKGWDLEQGVKQLRDNWKAFIFGSSI